VSLWLSMMKLCGLLRLEVILVISWFGVMLIEIMMFVCFLMDLMSSCSMCSGFGMLERLV